MRKLIPLLLGSLIFITPVSLPAQSATTISIQPGAGVGPVQLGAADSTLKAPKSNPFGLMLMTSGKDTEYEGQTVYYYFYGPKAADNSHPLQVYSDVNHKVFIFEINSPKFKPPAGIGVGSPESALVKAYGDQLKKQKRGSIYVKYSLGGRKGTDFLVRAGKVSQILVRSY